ncbi:MAG: AI-2E family transporter [Bacteroidales bacterium]
MIYKELKLPFYIKATIFLVGLFALVTMLYIAQRIIIPIIFAVIIAIVLHPVVNFFLRKKINRVLAIVLTLFLAFSVISAFVILLFSQAIRFSESLPMLVDKFTVILNQAITWVSGFFDINPQNIHDWITKTKGELINTGSDAIGQALVTVGNGIVILFLFPIYIFLILFYQPLLIEFIRRIFGISNKKYVNEIITQTKTLIQRYIRGLLYEAAIVATLYSAGLLIIGIDYAILLGLIAALLNIIPYIGGVIAASLFMIVAITTKNSASYPLMVLALYITIHLIDNNFIIPKVVASKVKLNALISIIVIITASALFGIPGMIICIPVTGIVKLIFDHIEPLKPWGFLLGNTMPPLLKIKPIRLRRIKHKSLELYSKN